MTQAPLDIKRGDGTVTRRQRRLTPVDNTERQPARPDLPDVTGMTNAEAAEAYAKVGCHVVPIRPGTKNPGSLLGNGWQQQATDDLDTVRDWWTRWPDAGIALHVGPSGLLVIDVDNPDNVPAWLWPLMEAGLFRPTTTDPDSRRGHYIFALRPGERFGNGLGKLKQPRGKQWGEVRCYGGAIVVAPTEHPRAAEGGRYSPTPAGPVPMRPNEIAQKLTEVTDAEAEAWRGLTTAELDASTEAFLTTYTDDREPYALAPILDSFDPTGRHASMWEALCWAMREGKAGRFPARRAADLAEGTWGKAFDGTDGRMPDPGEFPRMLRDAVHNADNDGSPEELWDRAHRDVWPSPTTPQKVAERINEKAAMDRKPLGYWRGEWYEFDGKCWTPTSDGTIRRHLYYTLRNAKYEKAADGVTAYLSWSPDKSKVDKVIDALKAEAHIPDEREEDSWVDGHDEPMISFANGLLRVRDRALLPHTPDYFTTEHLRFDYDPSAKPIAMQRFLDDLTGAGTETDPEAVEALLAFIGTRLVRDGRFQKMMIVVGKPGSGKGTLDRLLSKLLGRKHSGYQMDDITKSFPLEPLLGKTLVTISDQRAQLNMKKFTDLLLQVVGGDAMTMRLPYAKRSITLRLPLTFLILSNEIPVLPDNAGALMRRVIILKSPNSFAGKEDFDLFDKLSAELPALVNAALDAYARLREHGRFEQPESGLMLLDMLRRNSSYLATFIEECCEVGPDLTVPKDRLHKAWREWCQRNGHNSTGPEKFAADLYSLPGQQISQRKPRATDGSGKRVTSFTGVTLKGTTEPPPSNTLPWQLKDSTR